jgi:hypothetical protein
MNNKKKRELILAVLTTATAKSKERDTGNFRG